MNSAPEERMDMYNQLLDQAVSNFSKQLDMIRKVAADKADGPTKTVFMGCNAVVMSVCSKLPMEALEILMETDGFQSEDQISSGTVVAAVVEAANRELDKAIKTDEETKKKYNL